VTDDAWDTFMASLNPVALEQERMRPPLDMRLERPDGAEDVRMRHWHDEQRRRFHWAMAVQESRFVAPQKGPRKPWQADVTTT
jgi:hypothetical protein